MEERKCTLITGVCGTTGSQILDYLVENNEEILLGERVIIGIDNLFRGVMDNINHHLKKGYFFFIRGPYQRDVILKRTNSFTVCDKINNKVLLCNIDEIYHMAAVVPTKYFYNSPDLTYEENCKGTIDLFNWATDNNIKRFIVGSSSEIYGHIKDEDIPAKETTMSHFDSEEDSTRWSYAEGKLLTEHYLNHFKDKMERVCHLRFANTYGPRDIDNNHVIPYFVNCVVRGIPIHINERADKIRRTFLNNKDSARACVELMNKGRNGVAYNVGTTEEITIEDLLNLIIKIGEREFRISSDNIEVIRDISRPGDPVRRVLDTTRLKEDTGFVPKVPLTEGIHDMFVKIIDQYNKEKGGN